MVEKGFHQKIEQVTHDEGHTLDHIYCNIDLTKENIFVKTLYFSDHDALCIRFEKSYMQTNVEKSLQQLYIE